MKSCFTFIIFSSLLISSCDFFTGLSGKIVDERSGQPIANANVVLLNTQDSVKTNHNGYFNVRRRTLRLEDPEIIVSKNGYKPFRLKTKNSKNQKIYYVKSETIYIKFDKPFYPDPHNKNIYTFGTSINSWSQKFAVQDTLIIYLTKDDIQAEIREKQNRIRKGY